ncbi:MAG: hypothetical protein IIY52_07380 [Solobacterium sp.]|nr:hypothetical protein [Solobacterium sp.]
MSEGLDFSNDPGFVPNSWENLDENAIKKEITGLITRINNVSRLLERMVYDNDYEKTNKAYSDLWMQDLSPSGFVPLFCSTNAGTFAKFTDEGSAPPWYGNLSAEEKKAFDASQHFYADAAKLVKPMEQLRELMMLMMLSKPFKYMRTTLNFDEAGYNEDLYHKINQDVLDLNDLLNKSWDALDRQPLSAERYYNSNAGGIDRDRLIQGYRQARLQDYQTIVSSYKMNDRFTMRSDGTFSVSPGFLADMKVIDKYTLQISIIGNIEDDMKHTLETCPKITAVLNEVWNNLKTEHFKALTDTLGTLNTALYEFAEGGLNVWNCYKNRDDDAPYCFIRILPAFSGVSGRYGFQALNADPWHDGTWFYQLYQSAAKALSEHCRDYVYNHGHPQLK